MAIGSHSIPRFYLEQFASPAKRKRRPGRVWTYEKGKLPQPRATDSQGYENGYFAFVRSDGTTDESFESKLAALEDRYNDALVSAKSNLWELRSLAHKNELAFYIGMLSARSTSRRKFGAKNWARLQQPYAQLESSDAFVRETALHFSEATGELITEEQIREIIRQEASTFTTKQMTGNAFINDLLFHADSLKTVLVPKPWQVWAAPNGSEFVTSDNPVVSFIRIKEDVWHPGHGFQNPGVVIGFPLAPTSCVVMGIEGTERQTVDAATVGRMNEMIVRCCDRFVYSRTCYDEITKTVNEFSGTSVPGETAFIGKFPASEEIETHMRQNMGIKKRN